ncbi:1544_t:CDS:2 [Gigaspora rosea]|nr:1544_t:CDS:2 [Gigaspora rosea]
MTEKAITKTKTLKRENVKKATPELNTEIIIGRSTVLAELKIYNGNRAQDSNEGVTEQDTKEMTDL